MKREYLGDFIHGSFTKCTDPNGTLVSQNPGNLDAPKIPVPFSYEHIHEAVEAARTGFQVWRRSKAADRLHLIKRYQQALGERSAHLTTAISFETGKPLWESRLEVEKTLELIELFISQGSQTEVELKQPIFNSPETIGVVRFMPRGVFAVLSPAIQPLLVTHSHLIPSIIHGNCAVQKPSKHTPFTAQLMAEAINSSGIPPGVYNLIHGDAEASRRLILHAGIDGVFFAGNPETGRKIHKQLADNYAKTSVLEIGGRNATIIWSDAHYSKALHETLLSTFVTGGQRCTSTGRIFVHDRLFERFLSDFHTLAKKCRIGYAFEDSIDAAFMGPLLTERAVESYLQFQGMAVREGCHELMRGKVLERPQKGFYVSPSIHCAMSYDPKSIAQHSEVHGPNAIVYRVKDYDEIIHILNQPPTGLVASVYTSAREHYLHFLEDLKVGVLNWNLPSTEITYQLPLATPTASFRPMGSLSGYQCSWPMSSLEGHGDFEINLPAELNLLSSSQ